MWWLSDVKLIFGACCARVAIVCCRVEMLSDLEMSAIGPFRRSAIRRPLPSTGSHGSVPRLPRYYEAFRLPAAHPAALRCPSLGGTALCARTSLPSVAERSHRRPGALVLTGCPSCRSTRGDGRLSQVPGEPHCAHALLFDPGGTSAPDHLDASVLPSAIITTSAPTTNPFRGSITRPAHSLSTLRHQGRP